MTPRGWTEKALGEIATIERRTVAPEEIAPSTTYIGLENITRTGAFFGQTAVAPGELRSAKYVFSAEHILYGKLRPNLGKIAAPTFSGVCSTDILPVRPGPQIDRRYLLHYLRQPQMVRLAASLTTGINLPRLSPKALNKFSVVYPESTMEQRRIADVLDSTDALRTRQRSATGLLDELRASLVAELLFRYPNAPRVPIKSLLADVPNAIRTGPFGSQLLHSEFVDEGIAVLGIDNAARNRFSWGRPRFVTLEKYERLNRFRVRPGDVLVTIMGTCGRAAVVPADIPVAINTKHLCCITLDRKQCLPEYLWACLLYDTDLRQQLGARERGAVMPGLNMTLIKAATVARVPLTTQQGLVDKLNHAARQDDCTSAQGEQLVELFASLQQRAFRGEL